MPEIEQVSKEVSSKKIHESLTTARTLDIYNLDSSIHCYFRLLASQSQPARANWCVVGSRKTKVTFLPWTLTDSGLVRAGSTIEVCRIVAKWSGQAWQCNTALSRPGREPTGDQPWTGPNCTPLTLSKLILDYCTPTLFSKQESMKLHS